ncbi:MAG: GNAT family N-acetyltransferase [Candidatus Hydrogenedentes bacterium]|nr:GNAT family N-acetyltransferase [Candidatus Hydrogenedentota bacterium]
MKGEYTCYLVTEDGATFAYCLFRDDGNYYYMRQLFVERAHRRKGLATQLLDWMNRNVWTDKKVRLDVLSHNEEVIAFYKARVFELAV